MWAVTKKLGGGNSKILMFIPIWGRWTHFDSYFSKGLKPPTRTAWLFAKYIRDEIWLTSHMNKVGPLPVMSGLGTSNPLQTAENQWHQWGENNTPLNGRNFQSEQGSPPTWIWIFRLQKTLENLGLNLRSTLQEPKTRVLFGANWGGL